MDKLIFINKESLDSSVCDKIVEYFELCDREHYEGIVGYNNKEVLNKTVKYSVDLSIPNIPLESSLWYGIHNILTTELKRNIENYYNNIDPTNQIFHSDKLHNNLFFNGFLITKYKENNGVFKLHNDFHMEAHSRRLFNFIWYLNDVKDGGETEFYNGYKITPEKGKLVLFPSEWFFSHKGNIPKSNDKYIITGWIYNE